MSDSTCVFCKIIAGQIPATIVWDSPWAVAFLDINPAAPGHLLVVLREHYPQITDVPGTVLSAAVKELPRLAAAVLQATDADGLNILQNNGPTAGQVIPHVHFHLIPRRANDAVQIGWTQGQYESEQAMQEMAEKIRQALA